jgi:hypothetical protein
VRATLGAWTVQAADIIQTAEQVGRFNGFLRLLWPDMDAEFVTSRQWWRWPVGGGAATGGHHRCGLKLGEWICFSSSSPRTAGNDGIAAMIMAVGRAMVATEHG